MLFASFGCRVLTGRAGFLAAVRPPARFHAKVV